MQNGKNYHKHSDSKPQTQLAIEKFADMMIARMEEMKESHWKKGWIDGTGGLLLPPARHRHERLQDAALYDFPASTEHGTSHQQGCGVHACHLLGHALQRPERQEG